MALLPPIRPGLNRRDFLSALGRSQTPLITAALYQAQKASLPALDTVDDLITSIVRLGDGLLIHRPEDQYVVDAFNKDRLFGLLIILG